LQGMPSQGMPSQGMTEKQGYIPIAISVNQTPPLQQVQHVPVLYPRQGSSSGSHATYFFGG
jgi:hypothetical protein